MINILAVSSNAKWRLSYLSDHYKRLFDRAHPEDVLVEDCCECSCGATIRRDSCFDGAGNYYSNGVECSGCLRVFTHKEFQGEHPTFYRKLCADCRLYGIPTIVNPGALEIWQKRITRQQQKPRRSVEPAIRARILVRDNYCCRYCGSKWPDVVIEVDHVIAVINGGTDNDDNLVAACMDCNRSKGTLSLDDFLLKNPNLRLALSRF